MDEQWKKDAMADDTMVADLLLRLNRATPTRAPPKPACPLDWTVRQPRSKAVIVNSGNKPAPRASPTTPLSWSSGGVGGTDGWSEESSKPEPPAHPVTRRETTRSKVTSEATCSKRPRKKKTLVELKEAEILLLKERRQLKKELLSLRVTLEKERARNDNLKRMKLDVQSQGENERGATVSTSEAPSEVASGTSAPVLPTISPGHASSSQISSHENSWERKEEAERFELPDLNLPFDDDLSTEVPCGAS